jgi:hypothetical protein
MLKLEEGTLSMVGAGGVLEMAVDRRLGHGGLTDRWVLRAAVRVPGLVAILSSMVLSLLLVLAPATDATGSPLRRTAALRARHRALVAYRRDRAMDAHHRHERRGAAPRARAAVVGGTLVSIEEVPWQVAIFAEFEVLGEKATLLCGGSILDPSHIVTAAHCAFDPLTEKQLSPTSFVVVAGASTITAKEIKEGATVQAGLVEGVRVHPYFEYVSPEDADDVAVLKLKEPLKVTSAVKPIALTSSTSSPPEGTSVTLSGYGEENPITGELNEKLYSISMTLGFSRGCGGAADALFLCGSNPAGSACYGDSGGGVIEVSPHALMGVVDNGEGECGHGSVNGFANLTAPEIRDFVEGNDAPPRAPRGGGVVIRGVTTAGRSLSCEPGSWSNAPTFTYAFINKANGQVLQRASSSTYVLSEADVGRTIYCEVQAATAGGTGVARTGALPAVKTAAVGSPLPLPLPPSPAIPAPPQEAGSGGLPGSTAASVSSAQIASLLRGQLTPAGKGARIAALLKAGGFTIRFMALEAGTGLIAWYELSPGAKLARTTKAKPILVASGQASFSTAGTKGVKIKLTAAGRRLLGSSKHVKLTAKGTFTPTGERSVSVTKAFLLSR